MQIKLPHMPFKFDAPDGPMEITVRRSPNAANGEPSKHFSGAAAFIEAGPRALTRIQLSARAETYGGALKALTEGFKINTSPHDKDSIEFRVLTALSTAQGVVELDS